MSNAVNAIGTLLQIGDGGSPESFTTISEVRSIAGPDVKMDVKDITSHSSPNRTREKRGTLKDPGMLKATINWIAQDATHSHTSGVLSRYENFTVGNFKLVQTDPGVTAWVCQGMVTALGFKFPVDDVATADMEVTLTQSPTFA